MTKEVGMIPKEKQVLFPLAIGRATYPLAVSSSSISLIKAIGIGGLGISNILESDSNRNPTILSRSIPGSLFGPANEEDLLLRRIQRGFEGLRSC